MPMIRKHKWVEGAQPDDPVSRVAEVVIDRRLELSWYYLPLAAKDYQEDVEYVHQLRVASRRAVAALETFDQTLPPRRGPKIRKWLKKLRQSAGPARDDDVLAQRLTALQGQKKHRAGAKRLLREVAAHRQKAQAAIEKFYEHSLKKEIPRRIEGLVASIRWRDSGREPTFRTAADNKLSDLLGTFCAASDADLTAAEALHELRIEGKRLRYAMEIFHQAYPSEFREQLYPLVEEVQSKLGEINDHAIAAERLKAWSTEQSHDAASDTLEQIAATHEGEFVDRRAQFLSWWELGVREQIVGSLRTMISS